MRCYEAEPDSLLKLFTRNEYLFLELIGIPEEGLGPVHGIKINNINKLD